MRSLVKAKAIAKRVLRGMAGIVMGLVYYLIYALALPIAFHSIADLPVRFSFPLDLSTALIIFMVLGVAEGIAPRVVSAVFSVLSKVVGALYIYYATNGGALSALIAGYEVTIDLSVLVYAIVAGSAMVGIVSAMMTTCKESS